MFKLLVLLFINVILLQQCDVIKGLSGSGMIEQFQAIVAFIDHLETSELTLQPSQVFTG